MWQLGTDADETITDPSSNGSITSFLKGLHTRLAAGIAATLASGAAADGAIATLGAKADNKSAATDTTAITAMQILKEISYMLQNPAALAAGENHLGAVGGHTVVLDATPTLPTHANYVAGDYIGADATAMAFAGASRLNAGRGWVLGATLTDYALQSIAGELWLFDTNVTPPADSAPWSISDAHAARFICVIPFSTYYASALNCVSHGVPSGGSPAAFTCLAGSTSIYGCFVTRGAPTYASGDLTFRLHISQD